MRDNKTRQLSLDAQQRPMKKLKRLAHSKDCDENGVDGCICVTPWPQKRDIKPQEEPMSICKHELATRPILYTDTIGGKQVLRDDMWAVTTEELNVFRPGTWYCGCGHYNGFNLATCAACGRRPGAKD